MPDETAARRAPPLAPLLWVVFVSTLGYSLVLPFLVFVVLDFGGNAFVYGLVGATYSAAQLLAAPILGRWSDRLGRRRVLLLTQSGTALGWLLFLLALVIPARTIADVGSDVVGPFALTVPLLLVFAARAVDGASGGNVSVANAYVADVTPDHLRGASFGRMAVAQNLGFVIGPALAGLLGGTAFGAALPVGAALAVALIGLGLIVLRLPESQPCRFVDPPQPFTIRKLFGVEARDCHEVRGADRLPIRAMLAPSGVRLLLAIHFLIYLAFNLFYVALPMHAATALGWSTGQVGLFFAFLSVVMVVVQGPVLAAASRRVSDMGLLLGGGLVLACSFLFFATRATGILIAGAALLALGNGLMWPSLLSQLSKRAGERAQGAVQGFAGGSGAMASIVGLLAGGVLYRAVDVGVFVWAGGVAALAWAAAWPLRWSARDASAAETAVRS
jgi:MFS family permease